MKKIILACMVILSLCVTGGCSKDDGPSSGSKVKGNFKVDGKQVDLKYGYVFYDGDDTEYSFFDRDMLKYIDEDIEDLDIEYSSLWINYYNRKSKVDYVTLEYKINHYRETGYYYDNDDDDVWDYVSFSVKNGEVKCSSKSIPVTKYDYEYDKNRGEYDASFSVEGKTMDVTDLEEEYYDTRAVALTEVSDPKQITFLKSLRMKGRNFRVEK